MQPLLNGHADAGSLCDALGILLAYRRGSYVMRIREETTKMLAPLNQFLLLSLLGQIAANGPINRRSPRLRAIFFPYLMEASAAKAQEAQHHV